MLHQPHGGIGGTASDIRIQAEQILYVKRILAERTAMHTGQSVEQIETDSDRDRWFTAEQAKEYGFIDHVVRSADRGPIGGRGFMRTRPGAEEQTVNTGNRPPAHAADGLWQPPQARYVLPSFVERTPYGIKEMNPYNKLFEERIIFLGVQIDDASANDVMAQLITLESIDPDRDILMYINSPGGSMTSMMAIYDTMQYVKPDIQTFCLGQAASAAAVLLAAGTKGKRMALPNSRILIHQPAIESGYGQSSDLEIQAREIQRMRPAMELVLARHTGRDEEQIRHDIERDKFLTAHEAKEYGLVDDVLTMLKRQPDVVSS